MNSWTTRKRLKAFPVLRVVFAQCRYGSPAGDGGQVSARNIPPVWPCSPPIWMGKPVLLAAVTDDLVKRGLHAGNLVKQVAQVVGGGGGGRPTLAQAGGKDVGKLAEALDQVPVYIKTNLK